MNFHCLFEQSGTFKNVLKQHGHQAYDYDILNDYKQTDNQIDLFGEIQKAWDKLVNGKSYSSIFDNMKPGEDFILAFFPCTYFSHQNEAVFKGHRGGEVHNSSADDIKYIINREYRRARYFELFLKFCYVVQELKIPTIIENPYGPNGHNYLNLYSPYRPMYVDMNRSLFGDDKIKPTMFFAINYPMKEQFVWYTQSLTPTRPVENLTQRKRSEIRPEYADSFIKRFLGGVK